MKKVAVVYWSMTGNTEAMAEKVVEGITEAGAEATLFTASDFNLDLVEDFDAFAFGCPAMGDEELEADEFEPMYASVEDHLAHKPIVLFGSYSWNNGEWMDLWKERAESKNLNLLDTLIAYDSPDAEAEKACQALGAKLVD